jgi:hypothetical protein
MESPAVSGLRPVEPQLVESLSGGGEGGVCATKPSASLTPHIDFPRSASPLEAAQGVGWADYEPMGLLHESAPALPGIHAAP